jgi:hypothetical protein
MFGPKRDEVQTGGHYTVRNSVIYRGHLVGMWVGGWVGWLVWVGLGWFGLVGQSVLYDCITSTNAVTGIWKSDVKYFNKKTWLNIYKINSDLFLKHAT